MNAGSRALVEGRVRDVVPSGDAVVETPQGIVFTRGGLVGETVRIGLDPKAGRVRRGRIVEVLTPSPARVVPPCRYAVRCGGCTLMHASLPEQRALRARFLRDALRKAGAPEDLTLHVTESAQDLGYRRRARLAFRRAKKSAQLGFRRERSHELVDIESCPVLVAPLEQALAALRTRLLPHLDGEGELSLALGRDGRAVAVIKTASAQPSAVYQACDALVAADGIAGVALFAAGASKPALYGDARERAVAHDGAPLEGTIGGFSQAHAEVNRALVARVAELARTEGMRVLELYAGSGNLTLALAPGSESYTAVEQSPDAVLALRTNLAARDLRVKVVESDVAKALAGGPVDVVVLDPPRTGAPSVLATLAQRKPKRVIYVSCDPATLGRDVAELLTRGYVVTWAEAFEMFPQTADLESVVQLERAP